MSRPEMRLFGVEKVQKASDAITYTQSSGSCNFN